VDKAVERTGFSDFWELRRLNVLPRETSSYVPVILAMTIMVKNAKEYGLANLEIDPPLEYDTVEMTAPTHLQLIADLTECPVSQIRELNPALLKNIAPDGASLRVPKGTRSALATVLDTIPTEKRAAWRAPRVVEGETVSTIARRYRVSESSIVSANESSAGSFEAGDVLIIPAAAEQQAPAKKVLVQRASTRRGVHGRVARRTAGSRPVATAAVRRKPRPVTYSASNLAPQRGRHSSIKR
jgi:membrane-bound lytic murein transglycosylase D